MLQDRFRKKKRPSGGGDSSLDEVNIADQVPQIDDVLAKVDKALEMAGQLQATKGHWEYCCGVRRWVED